MPPDRREEGMNAKGEVRMPLGMACGKVILLGEHAVVHGVPAIAVGIDRGAHARATPILGQLCELAVAKWDVDVREGQDEPMLARAFTALVQATRRDLAAEDRLLKACRIEASAELPPGGGLGCSAATGVAVARALDPLASATEVARRAMEWERVFHGNPSGIDAAVAARGGCVYFKRGEPITPLRLRGELVLAVGSTGLASSTKSMVDAVARRLEADRAGTTRLFEEIHGFVREARVALETFDVLALGRTLEKNQLALSELSLSTTDIDTMCALARSRGALGAKLTGAGGGGSVIALVDSLELGERVVAAWASAGFSGFVSRVRAHAEAPLARQEEALR